MEQLPYSTLVPGEVAHSVYFHFPFTVTALDLGWNKGPLTTVSLYLVHLNGNNFNQSYSPMHKKI